MKHHFKGLVHWPAGRELFFPEPLGLCTVALLAAIYSPNLGSFDRPQISVDQALTETHEHNLEIHNIAISSQSISYRFMYF